MTTYAFDPPQTVSLPILGTHTRFPVRRVYCIGRNYADHAIEMGHDPDREDPFFFQKNPDNLDPSGTFPYPATSEDVHHEAEMAVMLHSGGRNIAPSEALSHVFGYALALDMTQRDLQAMAKASGRPWEIGKAFERSAPVGPIHPVARVGHPSDAEITLSRPQERLQQGNLNQMIWKVPEIIAYLSRHFDLAPGDVILTGTPAGVGPVQKGDKLVLTITGFDALHVAVT